MILLILYGFCMAMCMVISRYFHVILCDFMFASRDVDVIIVLCSISCYFMLLYVILCYFIVLSNDISSYFMCCLPAILLPFYDCL